MQEVEFEYEIVVVDSSEDDTAALLYERYPQVKVIRSEQRLYPGEARNIGVKSASGSIIAFIDADCIACDKWLETIRQKHELGYVAIGGAIVNGNPQSTLGWAEYLLEFTEFLPSSPLREVRTIPTCNISYKKTDVFERYGLFPSMRTGEDTRFNWMLVENGERILFDPSIQISHICDRQFAGFLRNQKILGAGFAESRSQTRMPGSVVAKFLWPLLPFIRLFLITKRVTIWNRQMILELIQSFPFVIVGLIAWQYGFFCTHCFGRHSSVC
jgi:glycosyltransferase involved in cell wall biosynthesis